MTVLRHESTCCATCHVYYEPGYEGACQEPGCGGTVSYDGAIEAVRQQLRGVVDALRDLHAAARTAERELPEGALGQRWQKAMAVARTTLRGQ